jgi:hypothetical protein
MVKWPSFEFIAERGTPKTFESNKREKAATGLSIGGGFIGRTIGEGNGVKG